MAPLERIRPQWAGCTQTQKYTVDIRQNFLGFFLENTQQNPSVSRSLVRSLAYPFARSNLVGGDSVSVTS